jgi:hypothetical protein
MVRLIEDIFPALRGSSYQVTSLRSQVYNCIAWAAGITDAWWWPSGDHPSIYWPEGTPREETLPAFRSAFATRGYTECENGTLEPGQEKIAFYADSTGCPTHAARQLPHGRWTSKLGEWEDIEHELTQLEGEVYGFVAGYMKRRVTVEAARVSTPAQ